MCYSLEKRHNSYYKHDQKRNDRKLSFLVLLVQSWKNAKNENQGNFVKFKFDKVTLVFIFGIFSVIFMYTWIQIAKYQNPSSITFSEITVTRLHFNFWIRLIALDKSGYPNNIFLISPWKHVMGTHWKRLSKGLLISNLNKWFSRKIGKISILFGWEKKASYQELWIWAVTQ